MTPSGNARRLGAGDKAGRLGTQKVCLFVIILALLTLLGLAGFAGPEADWYAWLRVVGTPALGFFVVLYLEATKREVIRAWKQG
ncbi:MAG: hypothetical protein AMJ81_05820 [Phycisphaerae bacterium SM23_33]|nr:MAG: hypothetical protein AMJ81_05820 [Phycisphaerae bacterium SM23_33]